MIQYKESSERSLAFKTAMSYINLLYDQSIPEQKFLEIAFIAWKRIGNREVISYALIEQEVEEGLYELPCNVYQVQAVTINNPNCRIDDLTNITYNSFLGHYENNFSIKSKYKSNKEIKGEYIPYQIEVIDGVKYIKVDERIGKINVIYTGLKLDNEGFPLISDKEADAISTYCMMIMEQQKVFKKQGDPNLMMALNQEWGRKRRNALVQEKMSQNHLDTLLNVKVSMNKKWYNKSLKFFADN